MHGVLFPTIKSECESSDVLNRLFLFTEKMAEAGKQKLRSVEPEYWIKRWDDGEIGWHKDFVDVMLKVNQSLA